MVHVPSQYIENFLDNCEMMLSMLIFWRFAQKAYDIILGQKRVILQCRWWLPVETCLSGYCWCRDILQLPTEANISAFFISKHCIPNMVLTYKIWSSWQYVSLYIEDLCLRFKQNHYVFLRIKYLHVYPSSPGYVATGVKLFCTLIK